MIVGTAEISIEELVLSCGSITALQQFAWRLVPPCARHIKSILDNQKYLVALEVRNLTKIPYVERMNLANGLLVGVELQGSIQEIISVEDIFLEINADEFFKIIFKEELKL